MKFTRVERATSARVSAARSAAAESSLLSLNRRDFIQAGLGVSAVAALSTTPFEGALASTFNPSVDLYKAVFDTRYAPALAFGAEMQRLGAQQDGFAGDITALWFNDLDPSWRARRSIVAGLTGSRSLFCLEQMGADHRMRVAARIEHRALPNGSIEHTVHAPSGLLNQLAASVHGRDDWAQRLARALNSYPAEALQQPSARATASSPAAGMTSVSEPLVSWLIAPLRAA